MRVLIVDDEAPARDRLRHLLAASPDVEVAGEATDGEDAADRIAGLSPDVVLLDIQMPRLDGFGLIEAMGPEMPLTIFCTAFDEHALRAFDARAIDYLLKPVQPERLATALERARMLLAAPERDRRRGMQALAGLVEERGQFLPRLLIHDATRAYLLPVERIDRISSDRNHCDVHSGGRSFRLRRTLASLESRLDPKAFLRISKSDIVRLDAIHEIRPWSHGDYHVLMRDGTTVTWSRRYRAAADAG
jgi:two-component system LytT family response regulator